METRRLRLFVVAYLRGLLKPYYAQGYASVVREELVLTALSAELDNETFKEINLIEGLMAQHVKEKSSFFEKLYTKILDYRHGLEFDDKKSRTQTKKQKEKAEEE